MENLMPVKKCPLNREQLENLTKEFPTPFHLYDEAAIRANARALNAAFAWNPGFKEYFAVKAAPNPYLMKILKAEGFGSDCSSVAELILSEQIGLSGDEIIFTSNDTPAYEYQKAMELEIPAQPFGAAPKPPTKAGDIAVNQQIEANNQAMDQIRRKAQQEGC